MSLYSLYERIPSDWIALGVGCLFAWLYLKLSHKARPERPTDTIQNLIFDVLFVYIIFSRFVAGLITGFNLNLKNDLLSMIDGSSNYGWFIGVLALTGYLALKFYRQPEMRSADVLRLGTESFLLGGVFVFIFLAVISLHPFRLEAILRACGMMVLFGLVASSKANSLRVFWLGWVGISVLLLVSSIVVPQTAVWVWFTPAQWTFVALMTFAYIGYTKLPPVVNTPSERDKVL